MSRFCVEIWSLLHQQANCFNYFVATFIFHFLYVMIHLRGTSRSSHRNWTSAWLQLLFPVACEATVVCPSLEEQVMCLWNRSVSSAVPPAIGTEMAACSSQFQKKKIMHRHVKSLLGQHVKPGGFSLSSPKQSLESGLDGLTQLWERLRMTKYRHLHLTLATKSSLEWQWRERGPFRTWFT